MTQGLSSNGKNTLGNWFGFADLGNDGTPTYNDRTKHSAINAFMVTLYAILPYKTKEKISENGFSVKALSSLVKFEPSYSEYTLKSLGKKTRKAVFPSGIESLSKRLISPLNDDGKLSMDQEKNLGKLIELCKEELTEIVQNPNKKQSMFEKFKEYYVLMENYFKYNSPKNECSMEYTFEDYRKLPTVVYL